MQEPTIGRLLRQSETLRGHFSLLLMLSFCLGDGPAWASVLYVKTNGNDALPGTSWDQAKRTVGAAIGAATAGDELWVARGTYAEHLTLKPDLALYGGFAGFEAGLSQRNWSTNLSVIWGTTNKAVIIITNAGPATRLDGFTIGGGFGIHGGGLAMTGSGPVIANNTIRNNITDGAGAGISIWYFCILSSTDIHFPIITNNVIVDNQSINDEGDGAGIAIVSSSPLIVSNVIARNTATRNGGGIACWRHSFPIIANNLIEANSASYDELTVSEGGGGIFASATDFDGRPIEGAISAPVIINNVIAANGGFYGGGITVIDSRLGAATIINNTIVANNGAGIFWANTWPTNYNNIVAFNVRGFERGLAGTSDAEIRFNDVYGNAVLGASANYRNTADRTDTGGNISAEPKFANVAIGEYHLQRDSPCVDAGSTALTVTDLGDIDGQSRVQGGGVDMGADESAGRAWNVGTPVVLVSPSGDDTDGSTWAKAKKTINGGIAQAATHGGEVWVAQATYVEHIFPPAFVQLYGGFAGNETNRMDRNGSLHQTILDGGGAPTVVYFRNAGYRVSGLDGFIVQNGGIYTAGNLFTPDLTNRFDVRGGGVYCRVSSPIIANNILRTNSIGTPFDTSVVAYGGGIYCYLSHAEITGNTFVDNEVLNHYDGAGGGIYCLFSIAKIEDNTFRRNHAHDGSAVYGNSSELRIVGNFVQSNALYSGYPYQGSGLGALGFSSAPDLLVQANSIQGNIAAFGGGLALESCVAASVLNNLILDNLAYDYSGASGMGGGIHCIVNINSGPTVIANNTIVGNSAPVLFGAEYGGGLALTLLTNNLVLANNIIASNSSGIWRDWRTTNQPVLLNNCLMNPTNYLYLVAGAADIQADPKFISRAADDFHLQAISPCIDTGTTANAPTTDRDSVGRPLDGNVDGIAGFDIGAYEFVHPAADTDHDGLADAAELVAGTDPTDPISWPRLDVCRLTLENSVALRWLSVTGRTYAIQWKSALGEAGAWQELTNSMPGCGDIMECREPCASASQRFYRLRVAK